MKSGLEEFRAGVRFSERLLKNINLQIKWIKKSMKNLYDKFLSQNGSPSEGLRLIYILFLALITILILPILLVWAIVKSI
jgi:hypothetical protein